MSNDLAYLRGVRSLPLLLAKTVRNLSSPHATRALQNNMAAIVTTLPQELRHLDPRAGFAEIRLAAESPIKAHMDRPKAGYAAKPSPKGFHR